jgi:predicted aconitase
MNLTSEEQAMLDGNRGPSLQRALALQVQVGEYFGATDMVAVSSVHVSGDVEELGMSGVEFLEDMVKMKSHCVVETLTDPRGVEFHGTTLKQDPGAMEIENRTIAAFGQMQFNQCNNCIIYQTHLKPAKGEHVGWGDTGSVIYVNSVYGARSNFEAGPAALAASLTGRVPRYGFHLDEPRKANVIVRVADQPRELADWGALGCLVGKAMTGYWDVPVFTGLASKPDSDALKHLGAALASFGSIAMFHVVGVTPEAPDLESTLSTQREVRTMDIKPGALETAFKSFDAGYQRPDVVVFSAPQLSSNELSIIAAAMQGRKVANGVRMFVTAPQAVATQVETNGVKASLLDAGVEILTGVCFYLMTPRLLSTLNDFSRLMTNSAKLANIMSGHGYEVKFRRLADCIGAASEGTQ